MARKSLPPDQETILADRWKRSRQRREAVRRREAGAAHRARVDWESRVLGLRVSFRREGVVEIDDPAEGSRCFFRLEFATGPDGYLQKASIMPGAGTSFGLPADLVLDLSLLMTAVKLAEARAEWKLSEEFLGLPQRGKPLNTAYYERLLAEFDALARESPSPTKELARRRGMNESTIRSQLYRARRLKD
jgi:hypothetical protein